MKLPPLPFRLRIALLSAVISGVVLVGFGLGAWWWLNHQRLDSLDREIRALAYRHPGWMNNHANYERLGSAIEFIFGEARKNQLVLLAMSAAGEVRFQSAHWPPELEPASLDLNLLDDPDGHPEVEAEFPSTHVASESPEASPHRGGGAGRAGGGRRLGLGPGAGGERSGVGAQTTGLFTKRPRFLTVRTATHVWRLGILGNAQDRLVVGLDAGEMDGELARMRNGFLVALPVALTLIGWGGWLVAGQAVLPLRSIARAAERTTARGLDQRIPVSGEDPEIDRLITVLNRMMDRLQASFRQATRFSADASHELKTPLAVMQAELEGALQETEDGSKHQQLLASLLEETERLRTIMRRLLLLAQADSGQLPLSPERLELSNEMETIAADARILAEAADVQWEVQIPPDIVVSADRVLLRLAISNLLENAIHYNETGGRVDVVLEATPAGAILRISNTGPGIPLEERDRIFERFHRGTEARGRRREGMGLGLSLAREIVLAHQGDLVLEAAGPARTVFAMSLPFDGPSHDLGRHR
jgi:two-component system heavy metal sensor histidine kinase CusS